MYMNNEVKISLVALIIQTIELLICIWELVTDTSIIFTIVLLLIMVSSALLFILGYIYYKLLEYVHFIEYLMYNEKHKFVLLPKIKMYVHSKKIVNKIHIKSLSVVYNIKKSNSTDNGSDICLGDMEIIYKLTVENKNIPNEFHFVSGNDYSTLAPSVTFSYGNNNHYLKMLENHEQIAPYWRGSLKHYSFGIENNFLPQTGDFDITIKVSCKEAFTFSEVPRDTIICLPEVFSNNIDKINYEFNLIDFEKEKFYCDAYKIFSNKGDFTTQLINCEKLDAKNTFVSTLNPNEIKGEKAYYFRLGTAQNDIEIVN